MSKIKDYIANNNGFLAASPEEASTHLGDADVIAYQGVAKDDFRKVVEAYVAPPVNIARRYTEYDFGSDIVVFSSLRNIVDLVSAPPQVETPVGTTIDPEVLEAAEEDVELPTGNQPSDTTWF